MCLLLILLTIVVHHATDGLLFGLCGRNCKPSAVNADWEFSGLVNKMWSLDKNRITFGSDARLAVQGRVSWQYNNIDAASYPLFYHVNKAVLEKPTYKAFLALLNNYIRNTGTKEYISNTEISENYNFLDLVLNTPIMKEVYAFLKRKGKAKPVYSQFKQQLYDLWFRPYYRSSRDRIVDSSGFEHVFVGEINPVKNTVTGFHNWLQFYMEEKAKNINYMGYIKKDSQSQHLLMMRFKWHDNVKIIGSSFIGTSPEFEFALYTAVYMMSYTDVTFKLDGMNVKVTCFGINRGRSIGSCYPDIV